MESTVVLNYKKSRSKKYEKITAAVREARTGHFIVVEAENMKYKLDIHPNNPNWFHAKVLGWLYLWVEDYVFDKDFKIEEVNRTTKTSAIRSTSGLPKGLR